MLGSFFFYFNLCYFRLSQLQSMNHNRDKSFKEERDERIRQMERIQQDVANIPQQAVSNLVGTDICE